MSLTGNLEDLPLLDILQIVSFSKKTGWLGISAPPGEGAVVFEGGLVVAAMAWNAPPLDAQFPSLAAEAREALVRRRIEVALAALTRLREGQFQFSLSDRPPQAIGGRDVRLETLASGIDPQELLLDLARGMDEDRRDSAAALEASFAAPAPEELVGQDELAATPAAEPEAAAPEAEPVRRPRDLAPEYPALRDNLPDYTLPLQAIPEAMLERLRSEAGADEPVAEPHPPSDDDTVPPGFMDRPEPEPVTPAAVVDTQPPAAAAAAQPPLATTPQQAPIGTLLLVDDEEDVRGVLARSFAQAGYEVVEADSPDAALKLAGRLSKAGSRFVLVTDLGMPTSGGSSFQGGFEVVKRLIKMKLQPPTLMMTETLSPAVRARAKQLGISGFVFKPGLSKLDPEQHRADLIAFAEKLLKDVLPRLAQRARQAASGPPPAGPRAAAPPPAPAEGDQDLKLLQHHLGELRGSADPAQISSLLMKVAREFFERGALFVVKNDEARGLGGFGPAGSGDSLQLLLRQVAIPLGEPSLFRDVVSSGRPWSGAPPADKWGQHLLGRLGRFRSGEAALLPLVAHRETIALLYGDNPETGRPLGRLDALELFIHQAGIAMENALLQRKLRAMQERG